MRSIDPANVPPPKQMPHKAMWAVRLALFVLLLLLAAGRSFADGKNHKLSKDLEELKNGAGGATVDVIIQFEHAPTDAQHRKVRAQGGILKTNLGVIKGAHYSVPTASLSALANDPDVAYITPDRLLSGTSSSTTSTTPALDYTPETVNAPVAWNTYGLDGNGIGVAVIDSGIYPVLVTLTTVTNPDELWINLLNGTYGSRLVYSQSFVPGTTDASDYFGHGTHVAGIVSGAGWASYGRNFTHTFKGIAPNANLINLRALDQNGAGTDSSVIAGIQAAISLKSTYNIRVINLSLGRQVYESYTLDPLCQAVEAAWNAGIVVVAAAGNEGRNNSAGTNGYGTIGAPGNDPYVITVGVMKTANTPTRGDDTIASYSSKGPTGFDHVVKPDIVAPGNRTISLLAPNSLLPQTYSALNVYFSDYVVNGDQNKVSQSYMRLSGTSMATPVVSGAAALLLQQNPSLTPDQIKARLMETASKSFPTYSTATDPTTGISYTSQYDIFTVGAGYLDVAAALASTDVATGNALSPTATYNSTDGNVYLVFSSGAVWGTAAVWGTSTVWGTAVVSGTSTVWGTGAVWGTSTNSGFGAVWGSGAVWGTSTQVAGESVDVAITGEN